MKDVKYKQENDCCRDAINRVSTGNVIPRFDLQSNNNGVAEKRYKKQYRIASTRLQNWDYGWNAAYFVTACTQNRINHFGNIDNGKMNLSEIGEIAEKYWREITDHFPFVQLGAFVVMPNHIHGIIGIDKKDDLNGRDASRRDASRRDASRRDASRRDASRRDAINRVSTIIMEPKGIQHGGVTGDHNPMLHNGLSKIVRWYKGRTSFEIRKINPDFTWQTRFYDHIIRGEASHHKISEYIITNPLQWNEDDYFEVNIYD